VLGWASYNWKWRRKLRFIPPVLELRYRRRYRPPSGPWGEFTPRTPEALRGQPGIGRDAEAEQASFDEHPLPDYHDLYPNGVKRQYYGMWKCLIPTSPRFVRGALAAERTKTRPLPMTGSRSGGPADSSHLTGKVQDRAAKIGLSAIGIARYDPKYTFERFSGEEVGDRVIVCILEQHYESSQRAPDAIAERAVMVAYAELMKKAARLATYLQRLGYRAVCSNPHGTGAMIHYAVQSGLGQLGFNGQLLTPFAGSRCRLVAISTDAPLDFDAPRDYGINKICDECQVCVRRCPGQAIPRRRRYYRGVEKAKINTHRCLPVVTQAEACAVCMKVCPVQRYGLAAVYEEFEKSGRILGKDTDELEGFRFPIDGRYYGPGELPNLSNEFFFKLT
jgi:NAD-dependent dihydropyrimidine dehydrogenase PreA subunit